MGQRVLSGVTNAITKEVFASLESHIEENAGGQESATPAEAVEKESTTQENAGADETATTSDAVEKESVAHIETSDAEQSATAPVKTPVATESVSKAEVLEKESISKASQAGTTDVKKSASHSGTPEAIEAKATVNTSTQQSNSEGGFFSAIANFFKSIFGSK